MILLREKKIAHCDGCLECDETGECHIEDDMVEINQKMEGSDAIIFASPNYYENVSGIFKDFMDRALPYYTSKKLAGKKSVIIGVGGGSGKEVIDRIKSLCDALQLVIVDSLEFIGNDPTDASKNNESIQKAGEIGEKLIEL